MQVWWMWLVDVGYVRWKWLVKVEQHSSAVDAYIYIYIYTIYENMLLNGA